MAVNAIYELMTRDARGPSAAAVYRTSVAFGLAITAYLTWEVLGLFPKYLMIGAIVSPLASTYLYLLPAVVATIAGYVTAYHARRIDFGLLRTTPMSPSQIAWGFVKGAWFYNRFLLGLGLVLLPIATIGWLQRRIEEDFSYLLFCGQRCLENKTVGAFTIVNLEYWSQLHIPYQTLSNGSTYAALWISTTAAVIVGVYFGLRNRNRALAALTTFFTVVLIPAGTLTICVFVGGLRRFEVVALFYLFGMFALGYELFDRTRQMAANLRGDAPTDFG